MNDPDYICTVCFHGFDQDICDRGSPPICPQCGSDEVLPSEDFRQNERINADESWAESWRE